jgi:hypothetical protein
MWRCVKLYHSVLLPVDGNANEAEGHTVCTTESKAVKTEVAILSNKMLLAPCLKLQHSSLWYASSGWTRSIHLHGEQRCECWFLKLFFMTTQHYLSLITLPNLHFAEKYLWQKTVTFFGWHSWSVNNIVIWNLLCRNIWVEINKYFLIHTSASRINGHTIISLFFCVSSIGRAVN